MDDTNDAAEPSGAAGGSAAGLSKRDLFAAFAMAGLLAGRQSYMISAKDDAKLAYSIADEMLDARERRVR